MTTMFRKSLLALATLASLAGAGLVTPAAAGDGWDRPDRRWREEHRDWGWGQRHRPYWGRERCWIETRRVRVFTPWGPRYRTVEERVCR